MPTITWSNPADITYGTPLSNIQLNATGDVAGTLIYTPAVGTVLPAGNAQLLSATFTPDDSIHYSSVTTQVRINVSKRNATWTTNPNSKVYGELDPSPLRNGSGSNFLPTDGVSATYNRVAGETVTDGPYHITATLDATVGGALDNYDITNSGADFNILKAPTSTTVSSSQNPSAYGQTITLTA